MLLALLEGGGRPRSPFLGLPIYVCFVEFVYARDQLGMLVIRVSCDDRGVPPPSALQREGGLFMNRWGVLGYLGGEERLGVSW